VISWIILIHKIWLSKKIRNLNDSFEKLVSSKQKHLLSVTYESHVSYPYFNIFNTLKEKTLEILNKNRFFLDKEGEKVYMSIADIELIESQLHSEIAKEAKILQKNMFVLPTVVTLGPFLGLLGTVWGILITFSSLQANSFINTNAKVLSGLSMALATTVVGLMVAIPALIGHNYLKHWIKDFTIDLENFSHRLLTTIEIQYRKVNDK
jgi:biopolymer transport protein TolQ